MEGGGKRPRLGANVPQEQEQQQEQGQQAHNQQDQGGAGAMDDSLDSGGIAAMLTDVQLEGSTLLLYGLRPAPGGGTRQQTVLLIVPDYRPYYFIACPQLPSGGDGDAAELREPSEAELQRLRHALNARLPDELHVAELQLLQLCPIMYYRPQQPDGAPYLKCSLQPGTSAKKAATSVQKLLGAGVAGFTWSSRGTEVFEAEVMPLSRFLSDTALSGGSWVWASPALSTHETHVEQPRPGAQQQHAPSSSAGTGRFEFVPPGSSARRSSCDVEVVCSCRCLHSLMPDAAQLAEADWRPRVLTQLSPVPPQLQAAAAAAARGDILPLQLVVLDVQLAPAEGSDRSCNARSDPVVAICCQVTSAGSSSHGLAGAAGGSPARDDEGPARSGGSGAAAEPCSSSSRAAFLLASPDACAVLPQALEAEGARLQLFPDERSLLAGWRDWLQRLDPDGLVVFQVRDSLGALAARFAALRLDGGSCFISRNAGRFSRPLSTKSVVLYSPQWVKSQNRMASTSNQETFKAEGVMGRLVYDVLRQVLSSQSLATFSLVDAVQSLLSRTLEILPGHVLAALQRQLAGATPGAAPSAVAGDLPQSQLLAMRAALRLARYGLARCAAVQALMVQLATVPESFELARATGLSLDQVCYNAQMIRVMSLLLRTSHRAGFILAGRQEGVALVESPHLMHPLEHKTAGLYTTPVATCDFASLYPSLYRAYNLCYTTLVHPSDVPAIDPAQLTVTPTGAAFLKPSVRPGVLPAILSALMSARATTRAALKAVQQEQQAAAAAGGGGSSAAIAVLAARAAVLDGRQKALKLTANALYGFTGAQASPLQCAPLADSCLALGAATCKHAAAAINDAIERQQLGPKAAGGKVIYAQTDSVFISLPAATPAEAVELGQAAAAFVSAGLPAPIKLAYERVLCPFMLLHVNRYAGRAFDSAAAAQAGQGKLLVKGVRAVWRQSAPFVRETLMGSLRRILMDADVPGAVTFAERQIARLLQGRVEVCELAMTGGLWRITGQQLDRAAAADDDLGSAGSAAAAAAAAGGDEEVKGPHASLAVRLKQRDPNKAFVLGERLCYVLLAGHKTQDEAAEDPLTVLKQGRVQPDYALYWHKKLQTPLKEIFSTALNAEQLRQLISGPHTQFRASSGLAAEPAAEALPAAGSSGSALAFSGSLLSLSPAKPPAPAAPPRGLGSPSPGRHKGRGGGAAGGAGAGQATMGSFFKSHARCLSCRQVLPPALQAGGDGGAQPGVDAGLCDRCSQEGGKAQAVLLAVVGEQAAAAAVLGAAHSACRRCHSGGELGEVACENGECLTLYVRVSSERQLHNAEHKLQRLDW